MLIIRLRQSVARIPASTLILDEDALVEQNFNIP
jgi:hypothetical protein